MTSHSEVQEYLDEAPLPATNIHVTIKHNHCLRCFNKWTDSIALTCGTLGEHAGTADPHIHQELPLRSCNEIVRNHSACFKCATQALCTNLTWTKKPETIDPKIAAKEAAAAARRAELLA